MKISVMTGAFHSGLAQGSYSLQQLQETLLSAGVSGLEPMWNWSENAVPGWQTYRVAAAAGHFSFSCLDVHADLGSGDEVKNQQLLKNLRQVFSFCRDAMGCPTALLYGSMPGPGMSLEEGRRNYGEMLGRCAELAAEYGVTVCIEDFGGFPSFTASSENCLQVMSQAGGSLARLNFDNGNFLLGDERPLDALEKFKSRLIHVHIKDFQRRRPDSESGRLCSVGGVLYAGCALGDGAAEVAPCIRRLQEIGYQGWLSAEIAAPNLPWVRQEIGYIAGVLKEFQAEC